MENLKIDLNKFFAVSNGVSTDEQRFVLNGVFIVDYEENKNNYRYYVSTDGRICLFYKTKIDKIEIEKGIILYNENNNLKISKKQWNELKTCDYIVEFYKLKNKYVSDFGSLSVIDGVYPNFRQLLKYQEFKKVDFCYLLSYKYHTILNKFWSYDSTMLEETKKIYDKPFYCDINAKNANVPLFNFELIDKKQTLKCSLVMCLQDNTDFDLSALKDFDILKQKHN